MPVYEDAAKLVEAVAKLERSSSLVFADGVQTLVHDNLARACQGQGFLLMGADGLEAFNEFNVDHVRDTFHALLQMAPVLTFGPAMPGVWLASLPSLDQTLTKSMTELPFLQPQGIHGRSSSQQSLQHGGGVPPVSADSQHSPSISTGGYADINRLHAWNLDFVEQTEEGTSLPTR